MAIGHYPARDIAVEFSGTHSVMLAWKAGEDLVSMEYSEQPVFDGLLILWHPTDPMMIKVEPKGDVERVKKLGSVADEKSGEPGFVVAFKIDKGCFGSGSTQFA